MNILAREKKCFSIEFPQNNYGIEQEIIQTLRKIHT